MRDVLEVNGSSPSGLTNTAGTLLDGAANGRVGSNFVATIIGFVPRIGGPHRLIHPRGPVSHAGRHLATSATFHAHRAAHHEPARHFPLRTDSHPRDRNLEDMRLLEKPCLLVSMRSTGYMG